jgi:hypothetical protein
MSLNGGVCSGYNFAYSLELHTPALAYGFVLFSQANLRCIILVPTQFIRIAMLAPTHGPRKSHHRGIALNWNESLHFC